MATDALVLDRINACYGESHVLHDLSFSLQTGHMLALLGRNGVGKTTCINAIIGFMPVLRGDIYLHGQRVTGTSPERMVAAGVGLVPQGRRIFPTLTVQENLQVAARRRSSSAGEQWTVERVYSVFPRLKERQGNLGSNLSGGEQQMLAIGRALMTNPSLLLLDEPSEGLAPLIVAELGQTLKRLKNDALSIIVVEQNSALALAIADDAVILGSACMAWQGTAAALSAQPELLNRHLGVAGQEGSPAAKPHA